VGNKQGGTDYPADAIGSGGAVVSRGNITVVGAGTGNGQDPCEVKLPTGSSASPGAAVSDVGISWTGLQAFCTQHKEKLQGKSTLQVRDEVIKILTAGQKRSFAEVYSDPGTFGKANVFVSHAWSSNFLEELKECIENWINEQHEAPLFGWFFWIDIFTVNQHLDVPDAIDTAAAEQNFRTFSQGFQDKLIAIGRAIFVLSPWDCPVWITRIWCLFEFYVVLINQLRYEFIMPPAQRGCFVSSLGEDGCQFLDIVSSLDVENATAFSKYDEFQIKNLVRKDLGGFAKVNEAVIDAIREFCIGVSERALRAMDEEG